MTNLMPDLTPDQYADLRESIRKEGVQVPVVVDETGDPIDGHNRLRIADELGIEAPRETRVGLTDEEKLELSLALNLARRHLTPEQRRELVKTLRAQGWSTRRIAKAVGTSEPTARRDAGASNDAPADNGAEPQRVTGEDGKSYPAQKPRGGRQLGTRGVRIHRDEPFVVDTPRKGAVANAEKNRLINGLSQMNGLGRGLCDLDLRMISAVCESDELEAWSRKAAELGLGLRKLSKGLKGVVTDGSQ